MINTLRNEEKSMTDANVNFLENAGCEEPVTLNTGLECERRISLEAEINDYICKYKLQQLHTSTHHIYYSFICKKEKEGKRKICLRLLHFFFC